MKVRDIFLTYKIWTVSNFISLSRVFLTPVFWYYASRMHSNSHAKMMMIVVAMLMVATDFFDGFFARLLKQETPLGQYLDPIADKVAILTVMGLLVYYADYPLWVVLIILVREIIGFWGGAFILIKKNVMGKPNIWGKWGVTFIALSGFAYVLELRYKEITIALAMVTLAIGVLAYAKTYWKTAFGKESKQN